MPPMRSKIKSSKFKISDKTNRHKIEDNLVYVQVVKIELAAVSNLNLI